MSTLLKAADLHRTLVAASVHAAPDKTGVPRLSQVQLESDGTNVLAIGTDTFTLGVARAKTWATHSVSYSQDLAEAVVTFPRVADIDNRPFTFTLGLPDAETLIKVARTRKAEINTRLVSLAVADSGLTVTFSDKQTLEFTDSADDRLGTGRGTFPAWKSIWPSGQPVARAVTGFNPAYLARFRFAGADRMQIFSFDDSHGREQKPLIVSVGENFVGLIMATKLSEKEGTWAAPAWLNLEDR